jgi:hypothetical protein
MKAFFSSIIQLCLLLCLEEQTNAFLYRGVHRHFVRSQKNPRFFTMKTSNQDHELVTQNFENIPQVLCFVEPKTQVPVILIGSMHYNPSSIELVKSTIEQLGNQDLLHSVVIETCASRWHKSIAPGNTSLIKSLLFDNEMESAAVTCEAFQRPVILGDQSINVTGIRVKELFRDTISDILSPMDGWKRIYNDLVFSLKQTGWLRPNDGDRYITIGDIFSPKLLLGTPVSLIRYPSAILSKAPLVGLSMLLLTIYSAGSFASEGSMIDYSMDHWTVDTFISSLRDGIIPKDPSQWYDASLDLLGTLGSFIVETALFSRVFLVGLLSERNVVLADYIRQECNKSFFESPGPVDETGSPTTLRKDKLQIWWDKLLAQVVPQLAPKAENFNSKKRVVVAVLGIAHCNGVKRLMLESNP